MPLSHHLCFIRTLMCFLKITERNGKSLDVFTDTASTGLAEHSCSIPLGNTFGLGRLENKDLIRTNMLVLS